MFKRLMLWVLVLFSVSVYADVFSCRKPNGEVEFSDTPCKAGNTSEVVPDRDHLTQQQQETARQKLDQQKIQVNQSAVQRAASEEQLPGSVASQETPQEASADEANAAGSCNDARGPRSNCADDLYRRQLPVVQPRPVVRPVLR